MMNIACHAWAFNDRSLEEAIGTIARLGFRNIDLGSGPHLDLERAASQPGPEAQRIRNLLDAYQLQLTDLYLMLPYINARDSERRAAQLTLFQRLLPFALALGTPGITISPGILHDDGPEHALARSLPALMQMSQEAEDTDLRLSFEPHMDSAITEPEAVLMIAESVPGLSITLDYAHMIVQGFTLGDVTPLLDYTGHVHIRQAVKGRLQTPYDQGRVDLGLLLRDLAAVGYTGALTVEYATTVGWHGMMPVNISQETVNTRNALRENRDLVLEERL
jgi:sugar phosphate isomerase/epimerase